MIDWRKRCSSKHHLQKWVPRVRLLWENSRLLVRLVQLSRHLRRQLRAPYPGATRVPHLPHRHRQNENGRGARGGVAGGYGGEGHGRDICFKSAGCVGVYGVGSNSDSKRQQQRLRNQTVNTTTSSVPGLIQHRRQTKNEIFGKKQQLSEKQDYLTSCATRATEEATCCTSRCALSVDTQTPNQKSSPLTTSRRPVRTRSANALVAASLSQHPHRQPPAPPPATPDPASEPPRTPTPSPLRRRPPLSGPEKNASCPTPLLPLPLAVAATGPSLTLPPPSDSSALSWLVPWPPLWAVSCSAVPLRAGDPGTGAEPSIP